MRFPQACNNNTIELIIMLTISLYGNSVELGFFCIFRLFTFLEFASLSNQRLPFSSLWTFAQICLTFSRLPSSILCSGIQRPNSMVTWKKDFFGRLSISFTRPCPGQTTLITVGIIWIDVPLSLLLWFFCLIQSTTQLLSTLMDACGVK